MRELALFAGVGGGLLGTHLMGFTCVHAVEIAAHAREVLQQRQRDGIFNGFSISGDIKKFDGRQWRGRVDMVSGGFPCQAFSTAARGRNNAADLWPEMRRVIQEVKPKYVFAENVAVRAIEKAGNDLCKVGYQAEIISFSAADVGADHVRQRYWLLAYTDDKSELRSFIHAKARMCKDVCESVWETSPYGSGLVDGVAGRVERYTASGNGQVPAVAAAALWTLAFA